MAPGVQKRAVPEVQPHSADVAFVCLTSAGGGDDAQRYSQRFGRREQPGGPYVLAFAPSQAAEKGEGACDSRLVAHLIADSKAFSEVPARRVEVTLGDLDLAQIVQQRRDPGPVAELSK